MDNKFKDYRDYEQLDAAQPYDPSFSPSAFGVLMRKVYTWMALALVVTGLTAFYVATSYDARSLIQGGKFWLFAIAEIVLVLVLSGAINRLSFATAGLLFIAYSVLNGITMSFIFVAYTHSSIATAFFVSAGTFAAMSLVGYVTKRDLTGAGKYLMMCLFGLIIAIVVNLFLQNPLVDWVTSIFGVLIFVGLTAWDTQKIKQVFQMYGHEINEQTQKLALLGSLSLYLDFINIFLYLLRFFGRSND